MAATKEKIQHLVTSWVDVVYRRLQGKSYLPPWPLRFTVGSPADFEATGAEFMAYLKLLCGLKSHHTLFDVGCGCGMMALPLRDFLSDRGRYRGMDIDRRAITWCQTHISACDSRFSFYHADLSNPRYNLDGTSSAAEYRFPDPNDSSDVILLKSVFTHMRPDGVQNYLSEIARLLRPGGRCLATFFLLDDGGSTPGRRAGSTLVFKYGDDDFRYADKELPERAIAFREAFVLEMLRRAGLTVVASPYYGTWSARPDGLSFQDMLLLARE